MSAQISVRLAEFVNKLLRKTGLQIVRTSTLEDLVLNNYKYKEQVIEAANFEQEIERFNSSLESRIAALEARPDEQALQNVIRYAMKAHWRTVDLIEQVSGSDKPSTCPLCGHNGSEGDFKELISQCAFLGGRLLRHVCPSCEVIFGPQKMLALDEEMLDLDYRNLYRIYSEGNSSESIIRTFQLLKPKKDGVYLDFGCGGEWSETIQSLRQEGWDIYGFEPSATHSSEHVFSTWAEIESMQFDGILSHNVLEHLFDPAATTRRLGALLSPGGRIVHATPCFDYRFDFSHYHVFFFTGKSPEILADRSGLHITDWVRDGDFIACTMQKGS
jgi:hypothetical protein